MSAPRHCPRCGRVNTDNWPLDVGGTITDGGCQLCWENDSGRMWWEAVTTWAAVLPMTEEEASHEHA